MIKKMSAVETADRFNDCLLYEKIDPDLLWIHDQHKNKQFV